MVIKIDLTSLPGNIKSVLFNDIDREYRHQYELNHINSMNNVGTKDVEARIDEKHNIINLDIDDTSELQKVERMIKDILIKQKITDYVVLHGAEEESKIVVLKREHGEQLGIYHCRHCAMAFEDEIQLSAHLRMHYFI